MASFNEKVDAYIAKSADFARPILDQLRELVHKACPDVEEKIKWGMPAFEYEGPMCSMAAFKKHVTFGFWKGKLMSDPALQSNAESEIAMGHLGRIESMQDLPADKKMHAYIREAMKLNIDGIKLEKKPSGKKAALIVPDYFEKAIAKNKQAQSSFKIFSNSKKKDYIDWLTEAKTAATRNKRLVIAVAQIAEGKDRHWKYKR